MRGQGRGIAQGQCRLQIGLDDIFRRGKDVGDQIVAEFDLVVERTANFQFAQRIDAGEDDAGQTDCRDDSEQGDGARNRDPEFHRMSSA